MSENAKTIAFVVIGLLAVTVALVTQPRSAEVDETALIGQDLTDEFDSPDAAKRLRIVRFNEDTATLREFEVAEEDGLWSIPSKKGYPADAARQMAEAATSLMDRKILAVASYSAGDHEQYGVIDPLSPKLEVGQKGVGTRVTMSDVHNEPLVDLIVGKAVKDAEGQRYAREAGRDIIYVIEIDPSKLSTNFEDWIEKDLLKLDSWDLQQVDIKDYSAELVQGMTPDGQFGIGIEHDRRGEMTLAYNDTDAKWEAVKLRRFDPAASGGKGDYVDVTLAEDEELNTETLNALKTALDDLKIVDVARKPAGLSQDLKAGQDFLNNRETQIELMTKGFTAAQSADGSTKEIISSDGEVVATMKNGTEYVLRFGNLTNAGGEDEAEAGDAATTAAGAEKPTGSDGVHRYLFVMARFNEAAVKQPELENLPELPAGADAAATENETSNGENTSSQTNAAAKPADETSGEPSAEGDQTTTEAADENAETPSDSDSTAEGGNGQAEASGDSKSSDEIAANGADDQATTTAGANPSSEEADEPSTEAPNENPSNETSDQAADSQTGDDAAATEASETDKKEDVEKIIAERKRIETENQRKLDEYKESLEKGRENVKELNLRFGDWYFVVDDEVFKKVRLGLDDVIKKKEKKDEAADNSSSDTSSMEIQTPGAPIQGLPTIPDMNTEE
jgi:hypothetical protein